MFDDKSDLTDDMTAENVTMWVAGKELVRGKFFYDYYGKNEKSKFVVKL